MIRSSWSVWQHVFRSPSNHLAGSKLLCLQSVAAATDDYYPTLKSALDSLGLSTEDWQKKWSGMEKRYGSKPDIHCNLEHNLKLLENWGVEKKDLKRIAMSTYAIVRLQPSIVEEKLDWLKTNLEMEMPEVARIVRIFPNILQYSTSSNVGPFLHSLVEGGYSKQHVKAMVTKMPRMLGCARKLKSIEHFLVKKVGFTKPDVLRFVMAFPNAFTYSLENNMYPSIEKYFSLGLTKADILRFSQEAPSLLAGRDYEKTIKCKIDWLMDDLGFDKERAVNVLRVHPRTFYANLDVWRATFDYFVSLGKMGKRNATKFVEANTPLLGLKVEGLKEKVLFAQRVLGKSVTDVITFPQYLATPFENVLCLRVAFLRHKGIQFERMGLHEFCEQQTEVFFERFDEPGFLDIIEKWKKLTRTEKVNCIEIGFPW